MCEVCCELDILSVCAVLVCVCVWVSSDSSESPVCSIASSGVVVTTCDCVLVGMHGKLFICRERPLVWFWWMEMYIVI